MKLPLIIVNFKIYELATGEDALRLAKIHEKVAKEMDVSIGIAVNALDLAKVAEGVDIPVFAQHIDPIAYGSGTGHIVPERVKEIGAYGTILNHAERKLDDDVLSKSIERAKGLGLFTVVCAETPERGKEIAENYNPDLVAVEPPELIGGDLSVSKSEPLIVERAVKLIGSEKTLVGAGVKDAEDVKIALDLGAQGVLLASGVTKSDDPYATLMDLASALKWKLNSKNRINKNKMSFLNMGLSISPWMKK